jgi:AcrR family transcriptional regulator
MDIQNNILYYFASAEIFNEGPMTSVGKTMTRDRILETALDLFNVKGSRRVTTNHIADAMGISPGNLYYHFKNKEHIIRELLARLISRFDALVAMEDASPSGLDLIVSVIDATSELIHTFRFIYVELAALLNQDDQFRQMYQDIKYRRAAEFVARFDFLAAMGAFKHPISDQERDALIFILWSYAEGIVTALHTSNIPVNRETLQAYFRKIVYLLKPHLQTTIWQELARALELPE